MSPSMEKERIDHQVLNSIFSGTEPDRNTLAKYQIRLAAFFGISVYKRLERCVGTHPEKLWVKIPNYFCLSAYQQALALAEELGMRPLQAHCYLGLGTLYAVTGQREVARTAPGAAITLYRAMEMTLWLPQAEATLAQADGR